MGAAARAGAIAAAVALGLAGCGVSNPPRPSEAHLGAEPLGGRPPVLEPIPEPVRQTTFLPAPQPATRDAETYTVVVNGVPVRDLLFALARDAEINIDIAGDIEGRVTLNAIDQTLLQILDRIALQVALRYRLDGEHLLISADDPYLHTYRIDYLNMDRSMTSRMDLATEIGTVGTADVAGTGGAGSGPGNNSEMRLENTSNNAFWDTLVVNVAAIIGIDDLARGAQGVQGNTSIIVNREAGYLSTRATERQHREVQAYIDQVTASARRQVLIEATVVEVALSDTFQAGVDWQLLGADPTGFNVDQNLTGANLDPGTSPAFFFLEYLDPTAAAGEVTATVKALEQFGDVQVLSSPKIIALNNQTAVLKVVDNRVYFTTSVQVTEATTINPGSRTFETTVHTVPVGLVMNVTPYISETEEVILNVRPTISRIISEVLDPNPDLKAAEVESRIPEIQVREMESMLRVNSGQIAVIGGLMQDKIDKQTTAVPLLSSLPLIGRAFTYRRDEVIKTELIVFLRPRVISVADLDGELQDLRRYLPAPADAADMARPAGARPDP